MTFQLPRLGLTLHKSREARNKSKQESNEVLIRITMSKIRVTEDGTVVCESDHVGFNCLFTFTD